MTRRFKRVLAFSVALVCAAAGLSRAQAAAQQQTIDFSRDIRPLLSAHCFKCHGPDEKTREGALRLDIRAEALKPADSGRRAIVPGKPDDSELIKRIYTTDAEDLMPPPSAHKPLTAAQKDLLRAWIALGADYQPHWAFAAPVQKPAPRVSQPDWVRNPIDAFILAKLDERGLPPNPPADRYTLARRLSMDLLGLPPSPAEAEAFAKDTAPNAVEKYVDQLLNAPQYGERWARKWLDLARYADTNGYEKDRPRTMWKYRDWVIHALNADMPFDQFTIEQLAGDMLPNATTDQKVATGFHRNTMINEEGGIDPQEFRYHAQVDRVNTTGTAWLGLTLGCAQCHTHKYDPIPHADYFRIMSFFDGADEPVMPVPDPETQKKREAHAAKIAEAEAKRAGQFPPKAELEWTPVKPVSAAAESKAVLTILDDGAVLVSGESSDKDTYTVTLESPLATPFALRVEALTDEKLPAKGPGRTPHGNFVLSEVSVTVGPLGEGKNAKPVRIDKGEADFEQDGFPAHNALDGKPESGWAIQNKGGEPTNVNRAAVFLFDAPLPDAKSARRFTVRLEQNYGTKHTLGKFRLSLGTLKHGSSLAELRKEALEAAYTTWLAEERAHAVPWTVLKPGELRSNLPLLTAEPDHSIFVHGDITKSDTYNVRYAANMKGVTALRLEALADERLPGNGPGRVFYEGTPGDFFLSELTLLADGKPVKLTGASETYAQSGKGGKKVRSDKGAAQAIDGDPQSGWSVAGGGQGQSQTAVFLFEKPTDIGTLDLQIFCERYYASGLGKFRVSLTSAAHQAQARGLSAAEEELLLADPAKLTPEQSAALHRAFLDNADELAAANREIDKLRAQMPKFTTALVLSERAPQYRRKTRIHHRGEFLQPKEEVQPEVLSIFPPLPKDSPRDRLAFARWLVQPEHPLTPRVTVNRIWSNIFGRGLVRTTEDFGFQSENPTHPELLDWLAVEFVKQGWSQKKLLKTIVLSSTYQQSSAVTPLALQKDPENKLLGRAPRTRADAEVIRDAALKATGLLSAKLGGPSVFPPQIPSITKEGAYGPLDWNVSTGEDRYRRGLYTFAKRTAPYAMFATFDGPPGDACLARREVSNTPLQALTLLNDEVFVEAAQKCGQRWAREPGTDAEKIERLVLQVLSRPVGALEKPLLLNFLTAQRAKLGGKEKEKEARAVAGLKDGAAQDAAAWTLLVRALLNTDEFVTRN